MNAGARRCGVTGGRLPRRKRRCASVRRARRTSLREFQMRLFGVAVHLVSIAGADETRRLPSRQVPGDRSFSPCGTPCRFEGGRVVLLQCPRPLGLGEAVAELRLERLHEAGHAILPAGGDSSCDCLCDRRPEVPCIRLVAAKDERAARSPVRTRRARSRAGLPRRRRGSAYARCLARRERRQRPRRASAARTSSVIRLVAAALTAMIGEDQPELADQCSSETRRLRNLQRISEARIEEDGWAIASRVLEVGADAVPGIRRVRQALSFFRALKLAEAKAASSDVSDHWAHAGVAWLSRRNARGMIVDLLAVEPYSRALGAAPAMSPRAVRLSHEGGESCSWQRQRSRISTAGGVSSQRQASRSESSTAPRVRTSFAIPMRRAGCGCSSTGMRKAGRTSSPTPRSRRSFKKPGTPRGHRLRSRLASWTARRVRRPAGTARCFAGPS